MQGKERCVCIADAPLSMLLPPFKQGANALKHEAAKQKRDIILRTDLHFGVTPI